MMRLEQTRSTYQLTVPYPLRHRAKQVPGYRWNAIVKCWEYPRNRDVYEALIAEFGEDLEEVPSAPSRSDSGGDAPDTIARLQAQNALLVKLFEEGVTPLVKKADEALKSVKSKSSALKMLKGALQVKDGELSAARDASRALETELSNMRGELQKQLDERTTLESENKRLSARLASAQLLLEQRTDQRAPGLDDLGTKGVLLSIVTPECAYAKFLHERTGISEDTAPELCKLLEKELSHRLQVRGKAVYELISEAQDARLLTADGMHCAQTIRVQRNIVVHDKASRSTYTARGVLALAAGALLWSELQ